MYLYKKGPIHGFSLLANKHYDGLQGKPPFYSSIITKLNQLTKTRGIAGNFFKDLAAKNYDLLEKLIVGTPSDLELIVIQIEANIENKRYPTIFVNFSKAYKLTAFGNKIKSLFDYNAFARKNDRWNAYALATLAGIDVCAYCNRNFTFTVSAGKTKTIRPEFDHFLSKARYPYLALSFYNLIPSCHTCNSILKQNYQFNFTTHLHPYLYSFDEIVRFSVELRKEPAANKNIAKGSFGLSFFYGDPESFDIKIQQKPNIAPADIARALKNAEVFKLEEIYNKHKDMVIEMIQNSIIYDQSYIDTLFKRFEGTLFNSRDDVLRHITKNYITESDISKRPFSKLSRDIHQEFGLIV